MFRIFWACISHLLVSPRSLWGYAVVIPLGGCFYYSRCRVVLQWISGRSCGVRWHLWAWGQHATMPQMRVKHRCLKQLLVVVAMVTLGLVALSGCRTSTWERFVSEEGGFSILAPAPMTVEMHTVALSSVAGPHPMMVAHCETEAANYSVGYGDYPPPQTALTARQTLASARDWIMENTPGGVLRAPRWIELEGHPGLAFQVQPRDGGRLGIVRLYLVDNRLYQLGVMVPLEDAGMPEIERYLDSFSLLETPEA